MRRYLRVFAVTITVALAAGGPGLSAGGADCKVCDGYANGNWNFVFCTSPSDLGWGYEQCNVICGPACASCIGGGHGGESCTCATSGPMCLYIVVEG